MLNVRAEVEVTEADGTVSYVSCKDHDLATNNFTSFLASVMRAVDSSGSESVTLTDTTNTSRTLNTRVNNISATTFDHYYNVSNADSGAYIEWGDGSGSAVTAARTDFKLVTTLSSGVAASSSGSGTVAFTRSATNSSGSTWTIREVGLLCKWNTFLFLFFHDGVTAATVANGATATVTYTVTFP
jgi:hypothetical protein